MNIFKKYYPIVKERLRNFKEKPEEIPVNIGGGERPENGIGALEDRLTAQKWDLLIRKYLVNICDDEERKFIGLLYFRKNPLIDVGIIFPLSIRACQEWREEILKNLVLLAAREGLIEIYR